jgi:hypothetical protein
VRLHWWRTGPTGAGGVTGYTGAAPVEDWRRRAAAPVEDRSRQTSREPAAGVMDRQRSGQSSDSESRSLRTAGLGQPAGPRHSAAPFACSYWSEEGDVGRTLLDRVEGDGEDGKPGRTGRIQDMPLREFLVCAVRALALTPRDLISHRFTLSLYKGLSRDQRYQSPIQLRYG